MAAAVTSHPFDPAWPGGVCRLCARSKAAHEPEPDDRRVTPATAQYVLARDGGCVGPRVGMPGRCGSRVELDHIDQEGLRRKGRSTPDNLVSLCTPHHRVKTEAARIWRPELREWVRRAEERMRLRT